MKQASGKRKYIIAGVIIAAAAALFLVWFFVLRGRSDSNDQEVAYVETIANLTGMGSDNGLINRYAGVVEAQDSWSVEQNSDAAIKEVLVKVGDEVKKGDPLFTYDVDKYEADLGQAEIELERMQNELQSAKETIEQLQKDKNKASAANQGTYTIQIKEQELAVKQTELDIESKKLEIEKYKQNIEHSTVTSEIDGVVKTVNTGDTESDSYSDNDNSLITIMQTGDLRVKGTINEQNVGSLTVGVGVIIHSRVDSDQMWRGTIDKIDTDNANSQENSYYGMDSGSGSTTYPFYVTLDSSDGMMIGQHVYLELDLGQADEDEQQGIWLEEYMIDMTDPSHMYVWADNNGRLEKREIKVGGYNEDLMEYEVTSGLTLEDAIAMPDERLKEGMKTKPMEEMPAEADMDGEGIEMDDFGMGDDGEDFGMGDDGEEFEPDDDLEIEADEDWGTEEGFEGMDGYQGIIDEDDYEDADFDKEYDDEDDRAGALMPDAVPVGLLTGM